MLARSISLELLKSDSTLRKKVGHGSPQLFHLDSLDMCLCHDAYLCEAIFFCRLMFSLHIHLALFFCFPNVLIEPLFKNCDQILKELGDLTGFAVVFTQLFLLSLALFFLWDKGNSSILILFLSSTFLSIFL